MNSKENGHHIVCPRDSFKGHNINFMFKYFSCIIKCLITPFYVFYIFKDCSKFLTNEQSGFEV